MLVASLSALGSSANVAVAGAAVCELGEGDLTISDLPAGSSVIKCDAVGRVVTYDDTGLTVPEPGTAVSTDALATDGGTHGFTTPPPEPMSPTPCPVPPRRPET
ncbi:hypothetical protein ACIPX0_07840 [Streptomyces sp. NPDC090075]|uniref:hypothetical protein n=1 Tax=Streptomyces sp. NPDC090075 TaxID=3365937 RepID=UPI0037FD1083